MWLCLSDSFLSAVRHDDDPETLVVRARARAHLSRHFPGRKIHQSAATDYRYRVFVSRATFACVVGRLVGGLDYGNFKDSVGDADLHNFYLRVWAAGRALERPSRLERPAPGP